MLLAALAVVGLPGRGHAATSTGCEGGGFSVLGLAGKQDLAIPAGRLPATFLVKGKYVEFTIVSSTFGITDYTFTGAPNPLDLTGGRRTGVFARETPPHRSPAPTR